jgi:hypothetical protein
VLSLGKNVISATDAAGNGDSTTIYYKGTGTTLPAENAAKVKNVTSSNPASPAYFVNRPVADQQPFYWDFGSTGDNTFDFVPSVVAGASWISTRRQSDPAKTTRLAFDLTAAATVYIMATKQATTPS